MILDPKIFENVNHCPVCSKTLSSTQYCNLCEDYDEKLISHFSFSRNETVCGNNHFVILNRQIGKIIYRAQIIKDRFLINIISEYNYKCLMDEPYDAHHISLFFNPKQIEKYLILL